MEFEKLTRWHVVASRLAVRSHEALGIRHEEGACRQLSLLGVDVVGGHTDEMLVLLILLLCSIVQRSILLNCMTLGCHLLHCLPGTDLLVVTYITCVMDQRHLEVLIAMSL